MKFIPISYCTHGRNGFNGRYGCNGRHWSNGFDWSHGCYGFNGRNGCNGSDGCNGRHWSHGNGGSCPGALRILCAVGDCDRRSAAGL